MRERVYYPNNTSWRMIAGLLCRTRRCWLKFSIWLILIAALLCVFVYHLTQLPTQQLYVTKPSVLNSAYSFKREESHRNVSVKKSILVIYEPTSKTVFQKIKTLLQAQRVDYDTHHLSVGKPPPPLARGNHKQVLYSLIIFTSLDSFQLLTSFHREYYQSYCRNNNIGIIFITGKWSGKLTVGQKAELSLYKFIVAKNGVRNFYVYPSPYLYITKGDITVPSITGTEWTFMNVESGDFIPVASVEYLSKDTQQSIKYPVMLVDRGFNDGVKRVFIGNPLESWIVKLLFLDAIRHFSAQPILNLDLKRYILVDIDDIFVAPAGTRMNVDDAHALVAAQQKFRDKVPGFTFNLGYAGYFYDKGMAEEIKGNEELVKNADQFWWFGHIWNHYQPHLSQNKENIIDLMRQNYEFAEKHKLLSRTNSYAVAPHHSGVYPIHQPLYDAWAEVWGVMVTSTEEYPHLRPDHMRRGFVHNDIKVLPRQLCNLYTKTYKFEHYATGKEGIRKMAEGGYVFDVLVNNPVSIFMTHISNYGNDRLALFLFEHAINFIQKWTNLQLITEPPLRLAEIYFDVFPTERLPMWTSPCDDRRHLDIWMAGKNCSRLPQFLIVGPQKTGSTALASFLGHHPLLVANKDNPVTFEEVQFFSDDQNYQKGIEWYMDYFQYPKANQLLFEKSATYFTHSMTPSRVSTLLPKAKIIIILHDPVIRAYSWYQHMRAHSDPIALENSFLSMLQANSSIDNSALVGLKKHCLEPGIYHLHIQRWLEYYSYHQVHFVDGTRLITDPVKVLHDIQVFLKITDILDYSQYIKFSRTKGFNCFTMKSGKQKCLGPGKGRHYPGMSSEARSLLQNYYKTHNHRLANLLHELKVPLPEWLTAKS